MVNELLNNPEYLEEEEEVEKSTTMSFMDNNYWKPYITEIESDIQELGIAEDKHKKNSFEVEDEKDDDMERIEKSAANKEFKFNSNSHLKAEESENYYDNLFWKANIEEDIDISFLIDK
jgi:hypothetical protein